MWCSRPRLYLILMEYIALMCNVDVIGKQLCGVWRGLLPAVSSFNSSIMWLWWYAGSWDICPGLGVHWGCMIELVVWKLGAEGWHGECCLSGIQASGLSSLDTAHGTASGYWLKPPRCDGRHSFCLGPPLQWSPRLVILIHAYQASPPTLSLPVSPRPSSPIQSERKIRKSMLARSPIDKWAWLLCPQGYTFWKSTVWWTNCWSCGLVKVVFRQARADYWSYGSQFEMKVNKLLWGLRG